MSDERESWLKHRPASGWDPMEVWRERVLRPRQAEQSSAHSSEVAGAGPSKAGSDFRSAALPGLGRAPRT